MTPWTAAPQASRSFTVSASLLKLMSIESVMPQPAHPLSPPSPLALSLYQHQVSVFLEILNGHRFSPRWSSSLSEWSTWTSILDFFEISLFFHQFLPHVFWNCYLSTYTVVIVTSSWCIYCFILRKCSSLSVVVILLTSAWNPFCLLLL